MPTLRDHARAGLILAYLTAITAAAIPTPDGMLTAQRRRDPTVLEAVGPWARLVARWGLAEDEAAGAEWLFDRGAELARARRRLLRPVIGLLQLTGTSQSWRMFGVVPSRYGRFEVHGRRRGSDRWEPLFVDADPAHQWRGTLLNQSRVRALRANFAERDARGVYRRLARWLADRALEDFPELVAVRVQMQGIVIPPADRLRATGGLRPTQVYWAVQHKRGDPR